jgi:hypothetical protein
MVDIVAGVMLYFTVSAIPTGLAQFHAFFLIFKGTGSIIESFPLPLPMYVLGGAADIMSAAILITGRPPILVGYKTWIAAILFVKGAWSLIGFMQG